MGLALLFATSIVMADGTDMAMNEQAIQAALMEHSEDLMALPGVIGTALGLCGDVTCIKVFVSVKSPELERAIQTLVGDHRVDVEETGEFRARPD